MVKSKRIYTIIFVLMFISANAFAGGPWTQKKGVGFFKLSEWWIVFDQHYNENGNLKKNITTGVFNTSLFGEYGLNDRWTGIVNANLFARNYTNNLVEEGTGEILVPGEVINSIGDIDLGIKYSLTKPGAKLPITASIYLGVPAGRTNAGELENLQTGDGEFNQLLQLDFGKSIELSKSMGTYITAYGGFNNRTNGFSDDWRYGVEIGLGLFSQKVWIVGRVASVESLQNVETEGDFNPSSIFENNQEYGSLGIEVSGYVTKKWGLSLANTTAFRGEIIAGKPSFSAGIFYDMSRDH